MCPLFWRVGYNRHQYIKFQPFLRWVSMFRSDFFKSRQLIKNMTNSTETAIVQRFTLTLRTDWQVLRDQKKLALGLVLSWESRLLSINSLLHKLFICWNLLNSLIRWSVILFHEPQLDCTRPRIVILQPNFLLLVIVWSQEMWG